MQARQVAAFGPAGRFYECPRWRAGRWWLSDMRDGKVFSVSTEGETRVEFEIDDRPGGLGWTRDGDLLVVSMDARKLLQVSGGGVRNSFDLGPLFGDTAGFLNDLAVSPTGHAYVGFDADFHRYGSDATLGMIVHVAPDGAARVAAEKLMMPNGILFSPDGATLVVAETMKRALTSFPIANDGSLGAGGLWAAIDAKQDARPNRRPPLGDRIGTLDGCAMDAEGFVWAADIDSGCLRIGRGGAIVDAVFLPDGMRAFACGLGGPDGRTLLICGADADFQDRASRMSAQLFTTRVDVPAA